MLEGRRVSGGVHGLRHSAAALLAAWKKEVFTSLKTSQASLAGLPGPEFFLRPLFSPPPLRGEQCYS